MASRQFLTDEQWAVLRPLIPPPVRRADGRGRPVEHDDHAVLDDVLCELALHGPIYPTTTLRYATCFRRFSRWVKDGTLERLLTALAHDLELRGVH